jgi:cyclic pyranopterin phosphate synthase
LWSRDKVVSREEMLERLRRRHGVVEPIEETAWAPADRFRLPDGTVVGIIASTTTPFCSTCDRARLTADGVWFTCLYAKTGVDLRGPLRAGASRDELAARIEAGWNGRADRGAELRAAERERHALIARADLKREPHLEMHTRGG